MESKIKQDTIHIGKNIRRIRKEKGIGQTERKGQILRSTSNTAPLTCGACNTQPEGLLTTA